MTDTVFESQDNPRSKRQAKVATVTDEETPQFYKVRQTHPNLNRRVVFRSVSGERARRFVESRFPRGSEVYLESPDGTTQHYEAERVGEKGQDIDRWQPFDPDSWTAPEEAIPPGQDAWADKEG